MPKTKLALNRCLHGLLTGGENMQDAAKKALEDMFGGKQDMLAAYDTGGGNSGKVRAIEDEVLALTMLLCQCWHLQDYLMP